MCVLLAIFWQENLQFISFLQLEWEESMSGRKLHLDKKCFWYHIEERAKSPIFIFGQEIVLQRLR